VGTEGLDCFEALMEGWSELDLTLLPLFPVPNLTVLALLCLLRLDFGPFLVASSQLMIDSHPTLTLLARLKFQGPRVTMRSVFVLRRGFLFTCIPRGRLVLNDW
jgi:hypothetical protein